MGRCYVASATSGDARRRKDPSGTLEIAGRSGHAMVLDEARLGTERDGSETGDADWLEVETEWPRRKQAVSRAARRLRVA